MLRKKQSSDWMEKKRASLSTPRPAKKYLLSFRNSMLYHKRDLRILI